MNLIEFMKRKIAFSRATFGRGPLTERILSHISKEAGEVKETENLADRVEEWADMAGLSLDGLWRAVEAREIDAGLGHMTDTDRVAELVIEAIVSKQNINERRDWPDWRTVPEDQPIEHIETEGE